MYEKKKKRRISETFAQWLLLALSLALVVATVFIYILQTRMSENNTEQLLRLNIEDVKQDIIDASDANILELSHTIADELNASKRVPTNDDLEWKRFKYGLSEINVIDENGIIVATTYPDFMNFDMRSGAQSGEFMVLLDGKTEYVQSYQPVSFDASISMKYAGVVLDKGGFVQVGYDAKRFQRDIDQEVIGVTRNRHVGEGGSLIICDENWKIVSDRHDVEGQLLETIGLTVDTDKIANGERFTATVYGVPSYCMYQYSEGYYIISVLPKSEAVLSRNVSVGVTITMMVVIFMALFGIIYYLLKRQIVDNIRKINGSLAEITGGNLDTTVDVHSNEEFASLSDDINTTVNALKHHIEEAAARIDQELEFARSIQLSALNTVFPPYPHRKDFDIYARMDTAKEVGGDFYDFYLLNEDTLGILIADVSGKGIPAAMMMMQAKTLISSLANSGINVDEVFTRANDTLCEHNDANMFVTAWMGILNLKTGLMTYVNAGHNPPLMRRNDGQFAYLKSPAGFVLAGWEGFQYRRQELQLAPGDQLYLYTDGVTEATDLQESLFGEEKLLAALNEYEGNEPQAMCDKVKQDVDRFVGEAPQFDDITMLSLTYKGGAGHE